MCKALTMGSGAEKTRTDLELLLRRLSNHVTHIHGDKQAPGFTRTRGPHARHWYPPAPAGFPSQAACGLAGSSAPALAALQGSCSAPSPICQPVVCPPDLSSCSWGRASRMRGPQFCGGDKHVPSTCCLPLALFAIAVPCHPEAWSMRPTQASAGGDLGPGG